MFSRRTNHTDKYKPNKPKTPPIKLREITVFALIAAIILVSQMALQMAPGVQLNGVLIAATTLAFKKRALIPIYVYVFLYCTVYGFTLWNLPYFYIWIPLWGMFLLAGKLYIPDKLKVPFYMALCGLYGFSFGLLYSPAWGISAGLSFKEMLVWIASGLFTDIVHGVNNIILGVLILPISKLLKKLRF